MQITLDTDGFDTLCSMQTNQVLLAIATRTVTHSPWITRMLVTVTDEAVQVYFACWPLSHAGAVTTCCKVNMP